MGGINDILARKLELTDVIVAGGDGEDLMRVGSLPKQSCAAELYEHVKKSLGVRSLKVSDSNIDAISKIAVVGGSGGDLLSAAKNAGADALVTGEAKHHHELTKAKVKEQE